MFKGSYCLSFTEKTITECRFSKVAFEQNLNSLLALCLEMLSFIYLSKASFSEQLTQQILVLNCLTRKWTFFWIKDVNISGEKGVALEAVF